MRSLLHRIGILIISTILLCIEQYTNLTQYQGIIFHTAYSLHLSALSIPLDQLLVHLVLLLYYQGYLWGSSTFTLAWTSIKPCQHPLCRCYMQHVTSYHCDAVEHKSRLSSVCLAPNKGPIQVKILSIGQQNGQTSCCSMCRFLNSSLSCMSSFFLSASDCNSIFCCWILASYSSFRAISSSVSVRSYYIYVNITSGTILRSPFYHFMSYTEVILLS